MAQSQQQQLLDLLPYLQHKSPSIKRNTIRKLACCLQHQSHDKQQLFESTLSIPISKLILDPSESVREAALQFLLEITMNISTNLKMNYMKTLLSVIWHQLGCNASLSVMQKYKKSDDYKILNNEDRTEHKQESSEEIRKLIVELLSNIINSNHIAFFTFCNHNDEIYSLQYLNIIHLLFNDKCPQIRIMICQLLLNQIGKYQEEYKENILFHYIFDDYAEYLCLSLAKGCMHQRGKIRSISFQLLSKIIQYNMTIKHNISLWITDDEKIWKYISYLMFDQMDYIKKSLAQSAFQWISLLIKYKNDTNNIHCAKLWMLLLNDDGINIIKQQNEFKTESELLQCISFIVTLCKQELRHWKESHRCLGIKCLVSLTLVLRCKLSSEYVVNLLPHFVYLIESDNDNISFEANKCLKLFGEFIPINDYSDFLFSKFNCNESIKSYLKISAQIFKGYNAQTIKDAHHSLLKICKSLSNSSSFQQNNHDDVGIQLLNAASSLLGTNICKQHINPEIILEILWLILRIHAQYLQNHHSLLDTLCIHHSHRLYIQIANILKLLMKNDDDDVSFIWKQSFNDLYCKININKKERNGYYLFAALMYYSQSFISIYFDSILSVFEECNEEKNTETIRYALLSILYHLLNETTNTNHWKRHTECIVFDILLPNIVWKVGKFRSKMRSLSLECMLLLYKKKSIEPDISWNYREKLISALKSRLDDFEYTIRRLSIQLFDYILQNLCSISLNKSDEIISESELKSLTQLILDRFDDSKDDIRILTCSTLQSLVKCLNPRDIDLYTTIIETSLIHLDDANNELQQRVFLLLKDASHFNASIFDKQLQLINTDNIQKKSQSFIHQLSKLRNA